jgi:hypothetical protein
METCIFFASHAFPWSQLLINAAVAVIGGLAGGLVGGLFAVHAQDKAIRAQREDALATERRQVNGIVQSIEQEIKEIQRWFGSLEEIFKARDKEGKSNEPVNIAAVNQNLFIIYDSNAAALGRIANVELRQNIVQFYTRAKTLVDLLNQNNTQFAAWNRLRTGIGNDPSQSMQLRPDLINWAHKIQKSFNDLEPMAARLLNLLEKYLNVSATAPE